jgi:hypothetical protein
VKTAASAARDQDLLHPEDQAAAEVTLARQRVAGDVGETAFTKNDAPNQPAPAAT